jgi:hypothetical protein
MPLIFDTFQQQICRHRRLVRIMQVRSLADRVSEILSGQSICNFTWAFFNVEKHN